MQDDPGSSGAGTSDAEKDEFVRFLLDSDVLTFGDFTTKSGRRTPYFVNTGRYRSGPQIERLGQFYARRIHGVLGTDVDVLFGPAYKGIPLAVATAQAFAREYGKAVGFCFDRKEAKEHGEGGVLVGHVPRDGERVVIVEDVTTAGTSVRETVPKLRAAANVELAGLCVSVDRQERGRGPHSALTELAEEFAMPTLALVTLDDVLAFLARSPVEVPGVDAAFWARVEAYRAEFGAV
ncbi:MAG: orotate phosphoribosyltransferase [Planctomycetota bacterium]